jgi:hypothetical protein
MDYKKLLDEECQKEELSEEVIYNLLNEKAIPDENNMNLILENFEKFLKKRAFYSEDAEFRTIIINIANMFVNYGYVPTKQDMINLGLIRGQFTKYPKEYFEDPIFVDKIRNIVNDRRISLYGKELPLNDLDLTMNLYGHHTTTEIKKKLKSLNTKPDKYIIKNLSYHPKNANTISALLDEYDIDIDFDCVFRYKELHNNIKILCDRLQKQYEKK